MKPDAASSNLFEEPVAPLSDPFRWGGRFLRPLHQAIPREIRADSRS